MKVSGIESVRALLIYVLLLYPSYAQELAKGEKDTVFIGRIKIQPSVEAFANKAGKELELRRIAESLDTQFINALNATRVFQIVERKRFSDLQEEQSFAATAVDPNDKNIARAYKIAGAKYAFLPQIDGFEDRSDAQQFQEIGRSSLKRKVFLSAVVQVVDTTTGKLMPDAPSIQLNKTEICDFTRTGPGLPGSDQILVELAKEMANKLSQELISLLRPAKVLTVTGRQILINRGIEAGFNTGDLVEIYAVEEVTDEDTGEKFRNEVPVGQAIITRADAKQSFANIEGEDLGIAKNCIARVIQSVRSSEHGSAINTSTGIKGIPNSPNTTPGSSEQPLKFE